MLQAFGDQLDCVGFLFARFAQPIPKRWNCVVARLGVVGPVLEHGQVSSELVEMPAPAAAANVGLDARLEVRIELLALLRGHWRDTRHIRMSEEWTRRLA